MCRTLENPATQWKVSRATQRIPPAMIKNLALPCVLLAGLYAAVAENGKSTATKHYKVTDKK